MHIANTGTMIRIFSHYVSAKLALLVVMEALVLLLAAYIGIYFQIHQVGAISSSGAAVSLAVFPVGMLVLTNCMGLYQVDLWENMKLFQRRLLCAGLGCFALAVSVSYLASASGSLPTSSNVGPYGLVIMVIVALTGSGLVRFGLYELGNLPAFKPRVLVLGTGSRVKTFAEYAERNSNHVVVGYVALQPGKHYVQNVLPMAPGETLLSLVEKHRIDQIVIGIRDRRNGVLPVQDLLACRLKGIKIIELHTYFEREYRQILLESINPSWMVFGEGFSQGQVRTMVKRAFDLAASAVILLLTLPVMLLAAICIFIESGRSVLYRQERIGQDGRVFTIYKFRSMKLDAECDGKPRYAEANDERTTRVGRIIRKLRIDELPQIINVFKGEMSFVGPRPERPFFVEELKQKIPYYELRHSVKPGITGWAQVSFPYVGTNDDNCDKLQYDLYYVKNHGLFLDLMILIATVEVVLWGKGAR